MVDLLRTGTIREEGRLGAKKEQDFIPA